MTNVFEVLAQRMKTYPELNALCKGRVYFDEITKDSQLPAVCYRQSGLEIPHGMGESGNLRLMDLDVVTASSTAADRAKMAETVINALNRFRNDTAPIISDCLFIIQHADYEQDARRYVNFTQFRVSYYA
jgi:hypothetical protein